MRITVDVEEDEILKSFNADEIVDHFIHNRDVDELLKEIGLSAIVLYLREHERADFILDEMFQISEVETHIKELQEWVSKQKKEVG